MTAVYRVTKKAFVGGCLRGPGTTHPTVSYPEPLKNPEAHLELIKDRAQAAAAHNDDIAVIQKNLTHVAQTQANALAQGDVTFFDTPPAIGGAIVETL